jgi:3-oxoacyl-[acyl-carrier protein] reductase
METTQQGGAPRSGSAVRVALVTGASRGIGRAIAVRLGREGMRVGVNFSRDAEGAEATAQAVTEAGGQALVVQGDVSDSAAAGAMFERLTEEWGGLEILVNNAGVADPQYLAFMTETQWRRVLDVSLTGAWLCSKHAAKLMIRARWGRIVNLSSVAGLAGDMMATNYAAAKAGLLGLTKASARELARYGITVNAIAPGPIETDWMKELPASRREGLLERIPLGRFGQPEEVAEVVGWLCGEAAGYITGQTVGVDGGMQMKSG